MTLVIVQLFLPVIDKALGNLLWRPAKVSS
jgi:hypothetical protein